jgi:hypothetical protein
VFDALCKVPLLQSDVTPGPLHRQQNILFPRILTAPFSLLVNLHARWTSFISLIAASEPFILRLNPTSAPTAARPRRWTPPCIAVPPRSRVLRAGSMPTSSTPVVPDRHSLTESEPRPAPLGGTAAERQRPSDSDHRASSLPNRSSSMHNTPVCEGGLEPVIVFR